MADLQLSIRYRTLPNKIGFAVMCMLLPVWALFVPLLLGLFVLFLLGQPGVLAPHIAIFIIGTLAAIPILSIMLTAYFEDDRLFVSKDGISFPLFMVPFLGFRRHRSWPELEFANIKRAPDRKIGERDKLLLKFGGTNGTAELDTKNIDNAHLDQMLLALELWGNRCHRTPELVDYQSTLQNENVGVARVSSTHMWEEELSRRFNATTFVPLEPETRLQKGRLRVVRQIAFGGLSAIYLAQKDEVEMVVVKEAIVPPNANEETRATAEQHFRREAKFLAALDHPQIARVTDHFVENGRNYLLLQYISGQDLRQFIKQNGPQTEAIVLEWAEQMAGILNYIHTQDPPIIHRDLTPDNMVLKNDGTVMLIDFGAANEFVGTATGTLVGKQAYMAPEQVRGKASLASDLYALGGTIFFWLTGRDPTPLSVSHPRLVLPGISEATDELVAKLTGFEARDRYATAADALAAVRAIRSGGGETGSAGGADEDEGALVGGSN